MSLGDLELHVYFDIFFLIVNRSGPKTNSTTNNRFYRALRRLCGPWCKQPLPQPISHSFIHQVQSTRSQIHKAPIKLVRSIALCRILSLKTKTNNLTHMLMKQVTLCIEGIVVRINGLLGNQSWKKCA
jgi:hypothetical protein